jgi:hypothetical protein
LGARHVRVSHDPPSICYWLLSTGGAAGLARSRSVWPEPGAAVVPELVYCQNDQVFQPAGSRGLRRGSQAPTGVLAESCAAAGAGRPPARDVHDWLPAGLTDSALNERTTHGPGGELVALPPIGVVLDVP